MAKEDIAALLALSAALFIAISEVIHQRAAQQVSDEPVGTVELLAGLLRDGRWWTGSAAGAAGFGLQAIALGLGSVLMVQALVVTTLLFALPINAHLTGRRVTRQEWLWATLLAASVTVIVTVGNPTAGHSRASVTVWTVVAAVLGTVVVLCLIGARIWSGAVAAVLLAAISGALWGVFAVLTKGVIGVLSEAPKALFQSVELYAWIGTGLAATAWQQSSFRAGS